MTHPNAEEFEAHRDDPDEWEPTVRRRNKPGRLDSVVSVRFSPDEESMLRGRAAEEGTTLSAMIREAALRHAQPDAAPYVSVTRVVSFGSGGTILPDGRIRHSRPDHIPAEQVIERV
jgi:hypothetical protein